MKTTEEAPVPPDLKHLKDVEGRPRMIGSGDVARLLEYWGFASNGTQHLKKLVGSGVLVPRKVLQQRNHRFDVEKVMGLYRKMNEAGTA